MIKLSYSVVMKPDFGCFQFLVEEGQIFDEDDYAQAFHLNQSELDPEDVHSAQDASARLMPGEWLLVTHEVISD